MSSKIKWNVIPPEIKNDEFYFSIINLIKENDINTILEIGASSGEGSTEALMIGKEGKPGVRLFSVEVCTERFVLLKDRYKHDANFFPYNVSSILLDSFPKKEEIINFFLTHSELLKVYCLDLVLNWYDSDVDYITVNNIPQDGINIIKSEHGIDTFDCVLIDSSEFTGKPELDAVYGAKFIILDDIMAYKNFDNHNRLVNDPKYMLLKENKRVRNGYSIFKRVD